LNLNIEVDCRYWNFHQHMKTFQLINWNVWFIYLD